MDRLDWISAILAICGVLAARERATELSIVQLCVLVGVCLLAYILIRRNTIIHKPSSGFPESSGPSIITLNDSLHQLYKSPDTPNMQIIFFHGLQSGDDGDAYLSTWKSGDGLCNWSQTWLIEKFPGAHVYCVSYNASVKKFSQKNLQGNFDMYNIAENLVADILQDGIGQTPYCPVILVGHCFGGLVINQLCLDSHMMLNLSKPGETKRDKLSKLLGSIRGIFYYGTPHHGSPLMDKADHLNSPLLKYFKTLSQDVERLNFEFNLLRGNVYPQLRIHALGEARAANSGLFRGLVAPEASSRVGDTFNVVDADHVHISRPMTKTNRSFLGLIGLLEMISVDSKEEEEVAKVQEEIKKQEEARLLEESQRQNILYLPKQITGIDVSVEAVQDKLVNSTTLGLVGMGGLGKTTLAKAVFNELVSRFEYTSFVHDVKFIAGQLEDVEKEVWRHMHYGGKKVQEEENWSLLKGKKLLLVLDDVSKDRDLEVLDDIANKLAPESRFIVTSRDRKLLKRLDVLYEVPSLKAGVARYDRELFMRFAFPKQSTPPSHLESLLDAIVEKCDGLPLTLEILGKYLHQVDEKEDWEQILDALDKADSDVTDLNENLWSKLRPSFGTSREGETNIPRCCNFFP